MSFWVRSGWKRRCPGLAGLRAELGRQVGELLTLCSGDTIPASLLRHSLALLRLYTALRGVAGLKFTEDEVFIARHCNVCCVILNHRTAYCNIISLRCFEV